MDIWILFDTKYIAFYIFRAKIGGKSSFLFKYKYETYYCIKISLHCLIGPSGEITIFDNIKLILNVFQSLDSRGEVGCAPGWGGWRVRCIKGLGLNGVGGGCVGGA